MLILGGESVATVDSLDIQISASVNKANASLTTLVKKLDKVSASLSGVNTRGFTTMGAGINKLTNAISNFSKNTKTADFSRLSKNLEKLSSISTGNMQPIASALKPLADGVSTLSNVNFDNKNLQSMINSLTRLSNSNIGNLSNVNFTEIGDSIKNLSNSLASAEKVQQSTISMTNAIAKLADSGANIPVVSSSLSQLGTSLNKFMSVMSSAPMVTTETTAFTQAIAQLSSTGNKMAITASNLGVLATELKSFMKTMSSAPIVSDSTIKMTQALANLASQGGKTGNATKELQQVFSSAEPIGNKFSNTIKKLSSSMNGLGSTIKKTTSKIGSFRKEILSAFGIIGGIYGIIRGVKKSLDISSDLVEVQNVVDTTFGNMTYKVEEFAKTSIKQFGMSELALKQYSSRFQAMGLAMGINSGLISTANTNLSKLTNGYVGVSNSLSDVSLNLTKLTADLASFYNMAQEDVAQDLESIFTGQTRPLRTYGLDLTEATLKEWALKQGIDADMKSMSQAEKTMLRYQYVLANTTAAQGDFAKTANTWANQIRILKQQFEQLASIVGTAFVNMLKPVVQSLNKAMAKVIEFAQTVVNALGKIFGWKLEINTKGIADDFSGIEDEIGGIADGIDDAASAAKKFNKQLQGFDALNNLTTSDAGGTGDIGSAFESIEDVDLGKIVAAEGILDQFESEIDTLYKLGNYLGESLKNFLDNIPWDTIKKNAREAAEGLADLINGFVEVEGLGYSIGKTLAESINTAFEFLNAFVHSLHWESIGHFIADTLNGLFENIDWDLIKDTFVTGAKGLADSINTFIDDFHWDNISNTISNAINIISETVYTFFSTIKWDELGQELGNQLMETIKKIDWEQIGKALGSVVQSGFDFLKSFIGQMDLSDIATALKNAFKGFINEVDTGDLALALTAMLGASVAKISFKVVMAKLKYKLFADTLAKALGAGGEGAVGAKAGTSLFGGLSSAWTSLGGLSGILTTDLATIMGAGTAAEIGTTLGVGILGSLGAALAGGLEADFLNHYVIGPIVGLFDEELGNAYKNFSWFGDGGFFDALNLEDFKGAISEVKKDFDKLVEGISPKWENVKDNFEKTNETIGSQLTFLKDNFKDTNEEIENQLTTLGENIISWWDTDIKGAFSLWGQDISYFWDENVAPWFTLEKWKELGENIKTALNTKWTEFTEWWKNTGFYNWWNEDVLPWFSKDKWTFSGIKEGFESAWSAAIAGVKEIWNKFASWLNDKLTWTIDPVTIAGKTVFEGAKINLGKIPMLANGAVFNGGNPYLAVVNDQPRGQTNIEAPLDTIREALQIELQNFGNNSGFNNGIGYKNGNSEALLNETKMQNQLLQQQNELLRAILAKPNISSGETFDMMQSEAKDYKIRTGKLAFT